MPIGAKLRLYLRWQRRGSAGIPARLGEALSSQSAEPGRHNHSLPPLTRPSVRVIGQATDGMLLYAEAEIRPILQSAPALDRPASRALVARLYPQHQLTEIADGTLFEQANPDDDRIYAGCFPGLTVVCTGDASLDQPSQLGQRFLREARGRRLYLHAMHCVVDWFAYAIWDTDGTLVRALSLSPM